MSDAPPGSSPSPAGYDTSVTREDSGRLTVRCDNCPVRMDLGPAALARQRNRTPSGWVAAGYNRHYCPSCAASIGLARLAAVHGRHLPLVAAR
jgi:hypothetical protein